MQRTTNLNLYKPEGTDYVTPDDFNANSDILDSKVMDNTDYDPNGTVKNAGGIEGFLSGKQDVSNLATSISSSSTHAQYPSAKCVYDLIGDLESVLSQI